MQLWILRHAKARAALPDEWDRDRPLTDSGREDARHLNRWLGQLDGPLPSKVLVSPAARTRQTAELALHGLEITPPVHDNRLWEAGDDELVQILDEHGLPGEGLMLIGHNPGLEWLVRWLTGQRLSLGLQAGCLVVINLSVPVEAGCGRIEQVIQPTDLT
jgi:phosphohistidine phosphatase